MAKHGGFEHNISRAPNTYYVLTHGFLKEYVTNLIHYPFG